MSNTVGTAGDRPAKLLTRSMPNLQLDGFRLMLPCADLELHTVGADENFDVGVIVVELSWPLEVQVHMSIRIVFRSDFYLKHAHVFHTWCRLPGIWPRHLLTTNDLQWLDMDTRWMFLDSMIPSARWPCCINTILPSCWRVVCTHVHQWRALKLERRGRGHSECNSEKGHADPVIENYSAILTTSPKSIPKRRTRCLRSRVRQKTLWRRSRFHTTSRFNWWWGRPLDVRDHHRSARTVAGNLGRRVLPAGSCRSQGDARVRMNTMTRDLDLLPAVLIDIMRLEVVADGLHLLFGTQLAIDTSIVSGLKRDREIRRGDELTSGVITISIYPKSLDSEVTRDRTMLTTEVMSKWSHQTLQFLIALTQANCREASFPMQRKC